MKKPILVTGSHRSGSTWVGKIISKAKGVGYIHEPFNIGISRYNSPWKNWFEYLSPSCPDTHISKSRKFIDSFLGWPSLLTCKRLFCIQTFKEFLLFLREAFNFRRRLFQRTVIKDPIAIMSTEWLYKNYNCDVIVTVRHPAAFVASLKVKDWHFDFNNFMNQPALMEKYLRDYKDEIIAAAQNRPSIVDSGILLWNIIYSVVDSYKENYEEKWLFVRHEDLSLNPVEEYAKVFSYLNLPFPTRIQNEIINSTSATKEKKHERDAVKNLTTWKNRLTEEEISRVYTQTKDVWIKFYSEDDWN